MKRRTLLILLGSIALLLLIIRFILPFVALGYINKALSEHEKYEGRAGDVDISLVAGVFVINDIWIDEKKDNNLNEPDSILLFTVSRVRINFEWSALIKGSFVGNIAINKPSINFVKEKPAEAVKEDIKEDTSDYRDMLRKLPHFLVKEMKVENGQIRFVDIYNHPVINITSTNIQVRARNMTNSKPEGTELPSSLNASGRALKGSYYINLAFSMLERSPTFDLNAKFDSLRLPMLSDFSQAHGNFEIKKGTMGLYTEFAAENGSFEGYVKPLILDLEIKKDKGFSLEQLWEYVVEGITEIFENKDREQLATKIPVKGKFERSDTDLWTAVAFVIRNAFVAALKPAIENSINLQDVKKNEPEKSVLKKIFGKEK